MPICWLRCTPRRTWGPSTSPSAREGRSPRPALPLPRCRGGLKSTTSVGETTPMSSANGLSLLRWQRWCAALSYMRWWLRYPMTRMTCVSASNLMRHGSNVIRRLCLQRWTVVALTLARLGVRPASIRAFLVIPVLYLGPLYARYLMGALPLQQNGTFQEDVLSALWCITGVRNFVVVRLEPCLETTDRRCARPQSRRK